MRIARDVFCDATILAAATRARRRAATTISCLVLVACNTRPSRDAYFRAGESAGVAIATNLAPLDSAPLWRLSARPVVSIGGTDGDEHYQFSRVYGARRLADGVIAVLNSGTSEVRFYDASGHFVRSTGRRGDGPGEFRFAVSMFTGRGDTVVVWDSRTHRFTFLAAGGGTPRTAPPIGRALNPESSGLLADGSFLVEDDKFSVPSSGAVEMPFFLARYAPDGTFADSLGLFPRFMLTRYADGRVGTPLFTTRASVAPDSDGFWLGTAKSNEAARYDAHGRLQRLLRWNGPDRRITPEDVRVARSAELAEAEEKDRAAILKQQEARPTSEQFPAYEQIAANGGELWVLDFERPQQSGAPRWSVFDKAGRLVARVAVPKRFTLRDMGRDYLLGVERDALDIEHVVMYRLDRRP